MPRILAALLLLNLASLPALGWTPAAEERIASKAVALAPPDLRFVLEKYQSEYRQGLREAAARPMQGSVRRALELEVEAAIRHVRERGPMRDLAVRLGAIAYLAAAANNPLLAGPTDLVSFQDDYERYFERSLRKFPTVFYGLRDGFDPQRTLDAAASRSRRFNILLEEEYHRGGRRRTSQEFDDRSTAFGIASVSYSRAVSDTVNLYFHVWKQAGGDVRSAAVLKKGNLLLNQHGR